MKLNCGLTAQQKLDASRLRCQELARYYKNWHRVFLWWPTRMNPDGPDINDCRWLETVERRYHWAEAQRHFGTDTYYVDLGNVRYRGIDSGNSGTAAEPALT